MKSFSILTTALHIVAATTPAATSNNIYSSPAINVDVYHAPSILVPYQGSTNLSFSPTAYTLIQTQHEALLVDAPVLNTTAADIAAWISRTAPGKKLKYIYITHGHFDHFGAFPTILEHFPEAKVVARKEVVERMKGQLEPAVFDTFWATLFPGLLHKPDLSVVSALPDSGQVFLEDKYELRSIFIGNSDTADSTVLHVPSIRLVVGGDVVYGHMHQYLAEDAAPSLRSEWIVGLERVKALRPRIVVPSHMQSTEGYGAWHLDETQRYIERYDGFLEKARSWEELEGLAKRAFPEREGSFILRYTAQAFINATL
jgi:glyoxylase-like metal-dependent hydrolase (beta-lactamase superfamily II)